MWGSIRYKQANNTHSAKIRNQIKGALRPEARTGQHKHIDNCRLCSLAMIHWSSVQLTPSYWTTLTDSQQQLKLQMMGEMCTRHCNPRLKQRQDEARRREAPRPNPHLWTLQHT